MHRWVIRVNNISSSEGCVVSVWGLKLSTWKIELSSGSPSRRVQAFIGALLNLCELYSVDSVERFWIAISIGNWIKKNGKLESCLRFCVDSVPVNRSVEPVVRYRRYPVCRCMSCAPAVHQQYTSSSPLPATSHQWFTRHHQLIDRYTIRKDCTAMDITLQMNCRHADASCFGLLDQKF